MASLKLILLMLAMQWLNPEWTIFISLDVILSGPCAFRMLTFCNLCKNCLSWRRQGKRKQDKIEANNNATLKRIASVAGAKRGGGGGEEKSAKREGRACYKSQCFCIAPTNFHTNPMTTCQLSIHDQSQVSRGGFLAWSKLNITLFTRTSKTFLMKEWNKVNF